MATKVAHLVERGLSLDAIKRLTPYQLSRIYSHPRDSEGRLIQAPPSGAMESHADMARGAARARGLPDWLIDRRWREHLKSQSERGTDG